MNTRHFKVNEPPSDYLVNSSDVIAGKGAEEAVSRVGADKPTVVALLQDINQIAFSKLQLVRVDRSVVENRPIPTKIESLCSTTSHLPHAK